MSSDHRDGLCSEVIEGEIDDPELSFEIFWKPFDESYAFLDRRGVDWEDTYDRYRGQVSPRTSRGELIDIFRAMVAPLRDGHVMLADGDSPIEIEQNEIKRRLMEECAVQAPPCEDPDGYVRNQAERFKMILTDVYLDGAFQSALGGEVFWGQLETGVGYLYFGSAGAYQDEESSIDDFQRLPPVLDRVFEDFAGLSQVIVDLRGNQGGDDAVALSLVDRFTDRERLVFTKAAFENGCLTPTQPAFTRRAKEPAFGGGTVIVLTSPLTASAAEILTLAFREMPHVTLMGTATSGDFSDIHQRHLPNGMSFGLSNEIYRAADDRIFEGLGVPPDIEHPFLPLVDREKGRDSVIDRALALFARSR